MVNRQFHIRHGGELFSIEYDTADGLEVLRFQIFSLTSIPPDDQKIFIENGNIVVSDSSDLEAISDKLRLVSIQEEEAKGGEREGGKEPEKAGSSANPTMSDEELARFLQAEENALYLQLQKIHGGQSGRGEFKQRIQGSVSQVLMYEDPVRQEAARRTVPVDEIEEKALVSLAKEGTFHPSEDEKNNAFLLQLLFWFKQSFRWVNSPPCDGCGGDTTNVGMGAPLPSESRYGASRVELYRCNNYCFRTTRFPRYNDTLKLIETRSGRCGEWANCFTLYCRAFGYEARLVLDLTDHVWTECFCHLFGRWMHLDPCEGVYDRPLLYENGWNKKLSYVIGLSKDGAFDVTKRYTRKWHEVLSRRNITTEPVASAVLSDLTVECRKGYASDTLLLLEARDKEELNELETAAVSADNSLSLPGRQSGAKEWRIARSEFGSEEKCSLSYSSCPVRTCIDEHVRKIYSSISGLLLHFVEGEHSKHEAIQDIEILKRLLLDLQSSSFKVRTAFVMTNETHFFKKMLPLINEFLSAISLKRESEVNGKICISLAGDPVQTSIGLPVALDALDEIVSYLKGVSTFDHDFVLTISRSNRISCGSVLASGEELPFGIATSAFDGVRLSKWEEPNGAKGCWIIYKLTDGQMHKLKSYDLMSANDAPERDPMNWAIEGSENGGSSWKILDQRTSQFFEQRFQRKRFKVDSEYLCNAFRFRFLSVRDANAQPRFQIGGIDLYAADS